MAAESAKIVDFQAYRNARRKAAEPAAPMPAMMPFNGMQPMMMWVPVWTFFPVMASPWVHAQ
ncbi:hypothetical protein [Shinella sp.]|uniref:hypothetical protein n=1 Tax=Shinella sp. TaxID=1870904 RepID=UPI003F71871C